MRRAAQYGIRVTTVAQTSQIVFDIFRLESDGSELLVGEAASYRIAFMDVEILGSRVQAKYIIRERKTGERNILNLGPLGNSANP